MSDAVGKVLVTLSDWLVAVTTSDYFGVLVGLVLLSLVLAAARWMRWDRETRERDAAHRAQLRRQGSRPDDV